MIRALILCVPLVLGGCDVMKKHGEFMTDGGINSEATRVAAAEKEFGRKICKDSDGFYYFCDEPNNRIGARP